MAQILFVTWDGGGNVDPALLIAQELRDRGDEVRFLGQEAQRRRIEASGFAFAAYRRPGPWTATHPRHQVSNAVGFLRLLTGRSLGEDLIAETRAQPADLVVVDCLLYGALEAASQTGLPHAVMVHSIFAALERKMASGPAGAIARARGLDPWRLWNRADGLVVTSISELDDVPGDRRRPPLTYSGPALPAVTTTAARPPDGARPQVLVSLSTTYISGQGRALQRILDAVAGLDVDAVVTTGPAVDPQALRAPANARIYRFVPHAEVMPASSLVVGHGGHSTTTLALAHDLPLVVLPMNPAFDQPLIAARIQQLGAGEALRASAKPASIGATIERVLSEPSYRAQAARLGERIRASRGVEKAADTLHGLLR